MDDFQLNTTDRDSLRIEKLKELLKLAQQIQQIAEMVNCSSQSDK